MKHQGQFLPNLKKLLNRIFFQTLQIQIRAIYSILCGQLFQKKKTKWLGDLCFMGEPNAEGEVEIGYGTYQEFRKRGFMTEAVGG